MAREPERDVGRVVAVPGVGGPLELTGPPVTSVSALASARVGSAASISASYGRAPCSIRGSNARCDFPSARVLARLVGEVGIEALGPPLGLALPL